MLRILPYLKTCKVYAMLLVSIYLSKMLFYPKERVQHAGKTNNNFQYYCEGLTRKFNFGLEA